MWQHNIMQPSYLGHKVVYYGGRMMNEYFRYANHAPLPVRVGMYGGLIFALFYSSSLWAPIVIGYVGYKALTHYYSRR